METTIKIKKNEQKNTFLVFINDLLFKSYTNFNDYEYSSLNCYLTNYIDSNIKIIDITDLDNFIIDVILDETNNSYLKDDSSKILKRITKIEFNSKIYFAFIEQDIVDLISLEVKYFDEFGKRPDIDEYLEYVYKT